MNDRVPPAVDRLHELLADRATQRLERIESMELLGLLDQHPEVDPYCYDRAAAVLDVPVSLRELEPLPADVRARVETASFAWLAEHRGPPVVQTVRRAPLRFAYAGWLAAACLAVALVAWWPRSAPGPAALFDALRADATSMTTAWSDANDAVTGDIVWNNARQQGVMRFRGLASNDPKAMQYQLWIFDRSREALATADGVRHPAVDGGVFDVERSGEDVYVTVNAKLEVGDPYLFAITTEPPGGVVEHIDDGPYRIILTAPVEG